jgi:hypothetical protein
MKRMVMMAFLMFTVVSIASAHNDDYVTPQAKKTLEKQFPGALYTHWEALKDDNMYLVRFVYNEKAQVAYITEEGTMVATIRSSNKESLPFMINETIGKRYSEFTIDKVEEMATPGDVSYLFWVQNKYKRILLRIYSDGSIHEIRKEKRKATVPGF